jgi:4-amino-4-deoxy-L-arabinose transferase-like glycosyltransferase
VAGLAVMLTAGRYGIFCDEFYYLACSRHLALGYVDHPPMIAWLTFLSRTVLGVSATALRVLPALCGAATILLTARIAWRLGGGAYAQALAAAAIVAAPAMLVLFGYLSMNAFDLLLLTAAAEVLVRILGEGNARLWPVLGLLLGVALLTKLTALIFGAGLLAGLLLTPHRRQLRHRGPYLAAAIALALFSPYIAWQIQHGWPTLEFMHNATQYKNLPLSPLGFLAQMASGFNPLLALLWIGGCLYLLLARSVHRLRPLAILFLVALVIFVTGRAKFYYAAAFLPPLLAAGAVALDRLPRTASSRWLRAGAAVLVAVTGLTLAPMGLPLLPVEIFTAYGERIGLTQSVRLEHGDRAALPLHYAARFGWPELAAAVAEVYHALPAEERARCAIYADGYSRAGALDYYGPALGLPPAISAQNSYWLWGTRGYDGETIIAVDDDATGYESLFEEIERTEVFTHPFAPEGHARVLILVCRGIRRPLNEIWAGAREFI